MSNKLIEEIESRVAFNNEELELIEEHFTMIEVKAKTKLLEAGKIERYIYFLEKGVVRGYQIVEGKVVIGHLVDAGQFFCSIDSFTSETPSLDCFDTLADCVIHRISKSDFEKLRDSSDTWTKLVESIMNEYFNCKLERTRDFQSLSAKERYLKFIKENGNLALNVSIENIASYLGMEPQSLSRIRKQITF